MNKEAAIRRHLLVELPGGPALAWVGKLVRLAWMPFSIAVVGRWLASGLEVLSSSLLAHAVVQLGGKGESGLPIPDVVMSWIRAADAPLLATLLIALGVTLVGQLVRTFVQWCLTWTHLNLNRRITPDVMEASLEPATRRIVDPPTAVQRWLLKIDVSYFIYESLAQTLGDVGTVLIILVATFRANATAGEVALAGLVLWAAASVPLILGALRASRGAAQEHEVVGRIIRDGAALRAELGRPSLRAYWLKRHAAPLDRLQSSIRRQGIWNAFLLGILGLISFAMPIVAVIASSRTGTLGSALAVLLYLMRMSGPLDSLAATLPWVQQNLVSVQRLFDLVERDRDRIDSAPLPFAPASIAINDWTVRLPGGPVFRYQDLQAERGRIVVIGGRTGSGKSTLLSSLAGQRDAAGTLRVDGAIVATSDPRWRETCAYVPQEPELVPGNVEDNLQGFPGWRRTPALARAVAAVLASRDVGADGEVAIDEKGVSVGQRRALSVLRAIGSTPAVLLLDEPLAGVDDALVPPIRDAILESCAEGKLIILSAHQHDLHRLAFGDAASVVRL